MYTALQRINTRPAVFSRLTTAALWTDPFVSEQMLRFHLDPAIDLSSRRADFIDASVRWITERFEVGRGTRVLDLGCGPGLYATRLAAAGAAVTGVDFSARSIAYAVEAAARDGLPITYLNADYLDWATDEHFDLVLLIFLDFCALGPQPRRTLLGTVSRLLEPGGSFLFDVNSEAGLATAAESATYTPCLDGGFWSPGPHFEFVNSFVYRDDAVTLSKYVIVEPERTREIYNWIQYYTPERLERELAAAGLEITSLAGDVAGGAFAPDAPEFAVIARARR